MSNKSKTKKDRKNKQLKDEPSAANTGEKDATHASHDGTSPIEALQSVTQETSKLTPPAESKVTTGASGEKMIPIYHLNQCYADSTGEYLTYIVPTANNMIVPVKVRLIPLYKQDQVDTNSDGQPLSSVDRSGLVDGGESTSRPTDVVTYDASGGGSQSSSAGVLELKGNSNVQVNVVLPDNLPPMVPVVGGYKSGSGSKFVLENNKDAQICMAPKDAASDLPAPREEIEIKGNENMQLYAQSGGSGGTSKQASSVSKDAHSGQNDGKPDAQTSTNLNICDNMDSQIMAVGCTGPAASSSLSNNESTQLMRLPNQGSASTYRTIQSKTGQIIQVPIRKGRGLVHNVRNGPPPIVSKFFDTLIAKKGTVLMKLILYFETFSGQSQEVELKVYQCWLQVRSICIRDRDLQWSKKIHFADIKSISSKSSTQLQLTDSNNDELSFTTKGEQQDQILEIIGFIVSVMSSTFPTVPLESIFDNITINPNERATVIQKVHLDSRNLLSEALDESRGNIASQPTLPRHFSLADFMRRCSKENVWLLLALKHSNWFISFAADSTTLTKDCLDCVAEILKNNTTLEVIDFSECELRPLDVHKLTAALSSNDKSKIVDINFSNNRFSKAGIEALAATLAKPGKKLRAISLGNAGITSAWASALLTSIDNETYVRTLCTLDLDQIQHDGLRQFPFREQSFSVLTFLAVPNVLQELTIPNSGLALEEIIASLSIGCVTHLRLLELAGNCYTQTIKSPPNNWTKFFCNAQNLGHIGISNTKLPLNALREMLESIANNEHIDKMSNGVSLDISSNRLGSKGAAELVALSKELKKVRSLNISDNDLKNGLSEILQTFAEDGGVKSLLIGKNLTFLFQSGLLKRMGMAVPRLLAEDARKKEQTINALVRMMSNPQSELESLDISDSQLGADLLKILSALASNTKIKNINVSGNAMGDVGATKLAEVLQTNSCLQSLSFDRNSLSVNGLLEIAKALTGNSTVQDVAMPTQDIARAKKQDRKRVIQAFEKTKSKSQAGNVEHLKDSQRRNRADDSKAQEDHSLSVLYQKTGASSVSPASSKENEIGGFENNAFEDAADVHIENIKPNRTDVIAEKSTETLNLKTTAIVHATNENQLSELQGDTQVYSETSFGGEPTMLTDGIKKWQLPKSNPQKRQRNSLPALTQTPDKVCVAEGNTKDWSPSKSTKIAEPRSEVNSGNTNAAASQAAAIASDRDTLPLTLDSKRDTTKGPALPVKKAKQASQTPVAST